jgi:condensin-2 complex subunit D3
MRGVLCWVKDIKKSFVFLDDVLKRLRQLSVSPNLIQSFLAMLYHLSGGTDKKSKKGSSSIDLKAILKELANICDVQLSRYVMSPKLNLISSSFELLNSPPSETSMEISDDSVQNYVFTLGEIAQFDSRVVPGKSVTMMQALMSSKKTNPHIRAHVFVSLGKLCLEDESVAKKCVAAFVKELESETDNPVIRNNIVVVLCDLLKRYSWVGDKYLAPIATCLRDPHDLVRRQSLLLLVQLLQEDFLKWKGVFVYRFAVALADPSAEVRQYGKFFYFF